MRIMQGTKENIFTFLNGFLRDIQEKNCICRARLGGY